MYDSSGGEGTCSYILDTGILVTHPEFEGRMYIPNDILGYLLTTEGAEWLATFTGDGDQDGYGSLVLLGYPFPGSDFA